MKSLTALTFFLLIFPPTAFASAIFSDVEPDDFAYQAIHSLQKEDIVGGYPGGLFKPEAKINRAEFLKIVLEAAKKDAKIEAEITGSNCFSDVKEEWFAAYVCTAHDLGIIDGYPDGNFYPEKEINFVEASKIIVNALKIEVDLENRKNWYEAYVVSLAEKEAIPFTVVDFDYHISRADMACLITNVTLYEGYDDCTSYLTYEKVKGISSLDLELVNNEKTNNHQFLKDKNNVYFSCDSDISSFEKLEGITPENFEILGHFTEWEYVYYVTYFTNGETLYVAQKSDPDSEYSCKIDIFDTVDIDSFEMVFDESKDGRYAGETFLMFLKDKSHVYNVPDLSVFQDADPETFKIWSILYEYIYFANPGEQIYFYYAEDKNHVWLEDPQTGEFEITEEIEPGTLTFIGGFNYFYEYEPEYPGYYASYFNYADSGICESIMEDFGYNGKPEQVNEDGVISNLIFNEDDTCTIRTLTPDEDQEDTLGTYASGFLMKDNKNIWIIDYKDFELNKIDLEVDLETFEGIKYGRNNFIFKDQHNVYAFEDHKLRVIEGMDAETLESLQFDESQWFLSDKNGLWDDESGEFKLINNNTDYENLD